MIRLPTWEEHRARLIREDRWYMVSSGQHGPRFLTRYPAKMAHVIQEAIRETGAPVRISEEQCSDTTDVFVYCTDSNCHDLSAFWDAERRISTGHYFCPLCAGHVWWAEYLNAWRCLKCAQRWSEEAWQAHKERP